MEKSEKNIAFASLDIGTSQVKLGVYCPFFSDKMILINNLPNELIYGMSGEVQAEYKVIREKSFMLFKELGSFLKTNNVEVLYIGICGHVSSLIEWNKMKGIAPEKPFPIWLDTTSCNSLDEYNSIMGNGKSKRIIGTFLPAGTNWLLTKLLHRRESGFSNDSIFLQVSDAIFYELCGNYKTHFSSQISMVNLKKREYAPELLDHLKLDKSFFPSIDYNPWPILEPEKKLFDFPDESFVFPAMADLYTSLYGLRLQDKEGFMLANTSEQAGAFYRKPPKVLDNFLSISFNQGFINYGSTNTGGNIVNWFLTTVLNKKVTPEILNELTCKAATIEPENTPIILPYLQGERAPLWNSKLTASILELRSSHTDVHLFRAILESISFARKQCFEELGINGLDLIKIGGGSSKNTLWNSIRASVLNKSIAVADEKELSMAGIIYYIMEAKESSFSKPAINFSIIEPKPDLTNIYEEKYRKFIKYQKLLS
ncbi:MAG: FGGY-family carbohydrate kinase [Chitinophagaceae bacterium]